MTTVSSVTRHFPKAQRGFQTTLSSTIASGATTVPMNALTGYTTGDVGVFVIEPNSLSAKQAFTGVIDTSGLQITNVVWTDGTNQAHSAGVAIVDYATATAESMISKGILVAHNQDGTHATSAAFTTPKITTSINDANGNEVIKTPATASAVNEITITNAATGTSPLVSATGGDTNIGLNLQPKGTGIVEVLDGNGNEVIKAAPATASAVNEITVANAATSGAPTISSTGGDTDVSMVVSGKGAGRVLPQLPIQTVAISGTYTTETVAGTITFPAQPVATTVLLWGFAGFGMGTGAPTQSAVNKIRKGNSIVSTQLVGTDNTKSSANGVSETRTTSLMYVDTLAANTAQTYAWTCQSTAGIGFAGTFFGIQVAS